jgi:hypothetical protein
VLTGLPPSGEGLLVEARLRVMMGQQLGLGRSGLGKVGRDDVGDVLVVLLPRALEQGLIRRLLDQRMPEEICGLRGQALL